MKPCYGKCDHCVWKYNGGCSEWNSRKLMWLNLIEPYLIAADKVAEEYLSYWRI